MSRGPESAKETKKEASGRGSRRKQERGFGSQAKKAHPGGRLSGGRWRSLVALRTAVLGAGGWLEGI